MQDVDKLRVMEELRAARKAVVLVEETLTGDIGPKPELWPQAWTRGRNQARLAERCHVTEEAIGRLESLLEIAFEFPELLDSGPVEGIDNDGPVAA